MGDMTSQDSHQDSTVLHRSSQRAEGRVHSLVGKFILTRVWGQFWPDTLFLGISSCFMLVQILSVTLCEMLVQILSVSYLVLAVSLSFPCVRYM